MSPERLAWLRLARTEGVGPVLFAQLIRRCGSAAKAIEALPRLAARGGGRTPKVPSLRQIEVEVESGQALGAALLCGPDLPERLAALDPPPPVLWALGRAELLHAPSIAVVGARNASAAGQRFARTLAADLGAEGYAVVSGMARGIDAAAHEGSLKTGSVAVLGGGVDDIYPPEHRGLYERLKAEGCIVAESPPGRRAQAKDFPRRNRIISGLSLGVVVVEAEMRSGSLITARLAGEQGREVFAVPGSPLEPRSRGTNDLIRQGATLCEGAKDVLVPDHGAFRGNTLLQAAPAEVDEDEVDSLRERLAALLSPTPVPRDDLVRMSGASAGAVQAALTELALAGRAELTSAGASSANS
jgi:DNA processing protein